MAEVVTRPRGESIRRPAAFDAFEDPRFRQLWAAGLCINIARWLDFLVFGWVILELTGSPLMVGLAAFCRMAPMMLLGPFAGVIADRYDRGRIMRAVQILNIVAALGLAALFGQGLATPLPLFLLNSLFGLSWAIDHPSRRTAIFTLVGSRRLTNAISLETVSMQGSKMVGPLLGGILLTRVGPFWCYLLLAALFVVALVLVVVLTRGVSFPRGSSAAESVLASLVTGFRETRREATIVGVLTMTILMNVLIFPYQSMLPVFAREVLHVGPELLGLLLAMDGLGSMCMALTIASRRGFSHHHQFFAGGSLIAALLVICLASSPLYAMTLGIQFLLGCAESCFATLQSALVLLAAPERLRGRAIGLLTTCIGTGPFGAVMVGWVASQYGAPIATIGAAASGFLLMLPSALRMMRQGSRFRALP